MVRQNERGSVVGFVIVGILLTAALVGGVWFAGHLGSSKVASNSDNSSNTTSSNSGNQATTDEQLRDTLSQQSSQSSGTSNSSQSSSSTSSTATSSTTKLPTTGPTDTLFEMLGMSLLVGVTVAYARSRTLA